MAVYFQYKKKSMVFACDRWAEVTDNLTAVHKTISALRGIERWGASDMLERAFSGFQALPAPGQDSESRVENCWATLNVTIMSSDEDIKAARNKLLKEHHPDKGGSDEMVIRINNAYEQCINMRKTINNMRTGN